MKPRFFIAIHYMHLGGAESALLGLLQSLDPKRVDIDLFVYSHEGELMKLIPEFVNLLPEDKTWSMFEKPMMYVLKKGYYKMVLARLVAKIKIKHFRHNYPSGEFVGYGYVGKEVNKILPDLYQYGKYDLAVSFLAPHDFVLSHVHADKKMCWIHTDYTRIQFNASLEMPVWESYDYIASISSSASNSFIKVFPSLSNKVIEIENIISPNYIRKRAEEFNVNWNIVDDIEKVGHDTIILSVGRFCEAKNYDNVPEICHRLIEMGCDVRWYIIGYGPDEDLIKRKIEEFGMNERVILLGKKDNPYPYIKSCDIYVQPSRYEGKSVTVREAQILFKPVIVANYPTADSQIKDGIDGVIVSQQNDECAQGISEFINDMSKRRKIIEYLHSHDYGNEGEVNKIYSVMLK